VSLSLDLAVTSFGIKLLTSVPHTQEKHWQAGRKAFFGSVSGAFAVQGANAMATGGGRGETPCWCAAPVQALLWMRLDSFGIIAGADAIRIFSSML